MSQQSQQSQQPKIGYVLSSEQSPTPHLVEFGVAAEQAGFDAIWTSDHFQPWQDNQGHAGFAWITLAAVAERTERVLLGTGVTCPTYRYNPAVIAQAFATLDQLHPGRFFIGVGSGEALNEQAATGDWGDFAERNHRLAEAVELMRRLWTGERVEHDGEYYSVHAKLYDTPPQGVPIYIAATGPESLITAGKHGDGLVGDGESLSNPEIVGQFRQAAREAGKDAESLQIVAEHWVIVGDEAEAREYVQYWQFLPKAWDTFVDMPDPREIERGAKAQVPVEDVLEKWTVSTDPEVHAQKIQELLDSGITHLFLHSPQRDQHAVIDFLGSQVLPRLKGREGTGQRDDTVSVQATLPVDQTSLDAGAMNPGG